MDFRTVSSADIMAALRRLTGDERRIEIEFLVHLAELDRRRGYEETGAATLWEYCTRELGLEDGTAYRRTHAARLIRNFPEALGLMERGRLSMTTLVALEGVLRPENAREVFASAAGKSKRELEYLVACLREPEAPVADSVRKLPPLKSMTFEVSRPQAPTVAPALPAVAAAESSSNATSAPAAGESAPPVRASAPDASARDVRSVHRVQPIEGAVAPAGVDRYRITLTVDAEFTSLLERATTILDHMEPGGNMVAILRRGLEKIVKAHEAKVAPKRPRRKRTNPENSAAKSTKSDLVETPFGRIPASGNVPAAVRREVWRRDGGCCSWPLATGGVCGSTRRLQFDHIVPRARGGLATAENLRLTCRDHNLKHARDTFGERWMAKFSRKTSPEKLPQESIPGPPGLPRSPPA